MPDQGDRISLVLVVIEPQNVSAIYDTHLNNGLIHGCAIETIGHGDLVNGPDTDQKVTEFIEDEHELQNFIADNPTLENVVDFCNGFANQGERIGIIVKAADGKKYRPVRTITLEEVPE